MLDGPPFWVVRGAAPAAALDRNQLERLAAYVPDRFKTSAEPHLHHLTSPPTYDVGIGVSFHQDWDYMPAWVVGIALTESTPENGSVRFVAAEHEQRLFDGTPCPDCGKEGLFCEYDCPRLLVESFDPGDLWAFRAETWHASAANFTSEPREVAYFRWRDDQGG